MHEDKAINGKIYRVIVQPPDTVISPEGPALGVYRLSAGGIRSNDAIRVQLTVEAGDPLQIQLNQRRRADLACREQANLLRRTRECRCRIHRQPT